MGLDGEEADTAAPAEQRRRPAPASRYAIAAVWVAIAAAVFVLLQARMPDADGIGGFAPLYMAVLAGALGLTWTSSASSSRR